MTFGRYYYYIEFHFIKTYQIISFWRPTHHSRRPAFVRVFPVTWFGLGVQTRHGTPRVRHTGTDSPRDAASGTNWHPGKIAERTTNTRPPRHPLTKSHLWVKSLVWRTRRRASRCDAAVASIPYHRLSPPVFLKNKSDPNSHSPLFVGSIATTKKKKNGRHVFLLERYLVIPRTS